MDYEFACGSLQTVRAARMFYEYGKLDRLLERDITTSSDDLYEVYYELLIAATDYLDQKYNESYECDHWYFSFRSMMQYYRLIREYGGLHGMKLSENPYVKKAEEMLSAVLYPCCLNGGMGWSYQKKISSEWSSGLIVETDGYFHYELDLLEALLSIDAWYTKEVQKLENLLNTLFHRPRQQGQNHQRSCQVVKAPLVVSCRVLEADPQPKSCSAACRR